MEQVSDLITHTLETMIKDANPNAISSKRKAISTILPFAISLEQDGEQELLNLVVRALRCQAPRRLEPIGMWDKAQRYTDALFKKPSTPSLDRAIALISPYRNLDSVLTGPYPYWCTWNESEVARWATAALETPYTEEVGRSVVDATLQVASNSSLRPHIPIGIWALFKEQPSLPPLCQGRSLGTEPDVINHIRELGDVEILKSYFLLVWSEWPPFHDNGFTTMETSIREDFCGLGMRQHREDLIQRLDHILRELGWGPEYFKKHTGEDVTKDNIRRRKKRYEKLKDILLKVRRDAAIEPPSRTPPIFTPLSDKLIPMGVAQTTTLPVPAPLVSMIPQLKWSTSIPRFISSLLLTLPRFKKIAVSLRCTLSHPSQLEIR